ncbi:MAG: hypothetical protein LBK94_08230 [Prevotellaceae bacterium]|jgi:hypothetical protein|nr:hypothetical protein [Prevotellaceae bacterium]
MKKLIKILILVFVVQAANAQNEMKGYFQTPNASSLGIFGQIPVSFYTEVPQINIPLYTVEKNGITVPISLDYHTNLLKPNNYPGWVGLGWNLTIGGSIIRIPNKFRDETICR